MIYAIIWKQINRCMDCISILWSMKIILYLHRFMHHCDFTIFIVLTQKILEVSQSITAILKLFALIININNRLLFYTSN